MKKIKNRKAADGHRLDIRPVPQKDGHSCGYCAMRAVYDYYGLGKRSLRERLGTDHGVLPALPGRDRIEEYLRSSGLGIGKYGYDDTMGTFATDIFAVLHEDGFRAEGLAGYGLSARKDLMEHIASGHPALVLLNWIHWVVVSGAGWRGVTIADSCVAKPYFRTNKWCSANMTGLILVEKGKRLSAMTNIDFAMQYAKAAKLCIEMALATAKDLAFRKLPALFM